jgi:SNF2 family DNA or RNA helicase
MKGSIEEKMLHLQEAKAAIGKGSMEKLKLDEARKTRLCDYKDLFSMK